MQKTIGEIVLLVIIVLVCAWGISRLAEKGITREEKFECWKLENYASTYPAFYLTKQEDDMCRFHGIIIDAPVK